MFNVSILAIDAHIINGIFQVLIVCIFYIGGEKARGYSSQPQDRNGMDQFGISEKIPFSFGRNCSSPKVSRTNCCASDRDRSPRKSNKLIN